MLKQLIAQSEQVVTQHLSLKGGGKARSEIPSISEIYTLFYHYLSNQPDVSIQDLGPPPAKAADFKEGIYAKDGDIILMRRVAKGEFKYVAMYCADIMAQNEHLQDELFGLYVAILKPCDDKVHYAPLSFSYLIKDAFFSTDNTKNIVPLQVMESAIPDDLEYLWVFLAMRYFHQNLSDQVPYKYLADEPAEIARLKENNLYD